VPASATGTYAIGLEARRTETVLAGYPNQQSIEYGAANPVSYFSVDGSRVAPRGLVVALSNCNQCHVELSLHGTLPNSNSSGPAKVATQKSLKILGLDLDIG
jgi:mono/diheme cytochrome c family protein